MPPCLCTNAMNWHMYSIHHALLMQGSANAGSANAGFSLQTHSPLEISTLLIPGPRLLTPMFIKKYCSKNYCWWIFNSLLTKVPPQNILKLTWTVRPIQGLPRADPQKRGAATHPLDASSPAKGRVTVAQQLPTDSRKCVSLSSQLADSTAFPGRG